jgi:cellulose synthase/poly-beta-1,6-N-acetylglucosamine synthase-like glycosyltransferase
MGAYFEILIRHIYTKIKIKYLINFYLLWLFYFIIIYLTYLYFD